MYNVQIPGFGRLQLEYVVLDYNGTLAVDGTLLPGAVEASMEVTTLQVHVITADTARVSYNDLSN